MKFFFYEYLEINQSYCVLKSVAHSGDGNCCKILTAIMGNIHPEVWSEMLFPRQLKKVVIFLLFFLLNIVVRLCNIYLSLLCPLRCCNNVNFHYWGTNKISLLWFFFNLIFFILHLHSIISFTSEKKFFFLVSIIYFSFLSLSEKIIFFSIKKKSES